MLVNQKRFMVGKKKKKKNIPKNKFSISNNINKILDVLVFIDEHFCAAVGQIISNSFRPVTARVATVIQCALLGRVNLSCCKWIIPQTYEHYSPAVCSDERVLCVF